MMKMAEKLMKMAEESMEMVMASMEMDPRVIRRPESVLEQRFLSPELGLTTTAAAELFVDF